MKRTNLNAVVDAVAAAEALVLLSTGLLIWLRLPPGSGHAATVWSLNRHEWGDIHAWVAMAMVATLLVHLALHWKWIVCVLAGQDAKAKRRRKLAGAVVLGVTMLAAASPFVAPVETRQQTARGRKHLAAPAPVAEHGTSELSINGRTTLGEAAALLGVSTTELASELGLPDSIGEDQRLGPLARELGLTMGELREQLPASR